MHAGVTMQHKNQLSQLGFDNYVRSEYTTCFGLQDHHHVLIKTLNKLYTTKNPWISLRSYSFTEMSEAQKCFNGFTSILVECDVTYC